MRYSQGGGVNTSLSRLMYCTHVYVCPVLVAVLFLSCVLCDYLPWHGHVLPGTQVVKIMCGHQLYEQG